MFVRHLLERPTIVVGPVPRLYSCGVVPRHSPRPSYVERLAILVGPVPHPYHVAGLGATHDRAPRHLPRPSLQYIRAVIQSAGFFKN